LFSPIPHIRREPIGMLIVPLVTTLTSGWASTPWRAFPYFVDPFFGALLEVLHPTDAYN